MSSAVPRATSVKVRPVTGVGFSKYWPFTGGTHSPPMKILQKVIAGQVRLFLVGKPAGHPGSPAAR